MKRIRIVFCILAVITGILWWGIFNYHSRRKAVILNSWNNLQLQVVQAAARSAEAWLQVRVREQGLDKDSTEQEIFHKFIEPILLLKSGAAWIYNKKYVIYDKNSTLPDIYKQKSMRQIFDLQKKKGAYHYEELCSGVMSGSEGTGWYVWLPEKGREYVAWTPVNMSYDTWTVGLSTPEAEIYDHYGIHVYLRRELTAGIIISILLCAVFILVYQQQKRNQSVMALMKLKSDELANTNKELLYQLGERKRAEKEREHLLVELEKKYKGERDAWKEVSFRAAHKVGNAIFGLRGEVDWLQVIFDKKPMNEKEMGTAIRGTKEALKEANSIVREFKKYYRPEALRFKPVQINDILENAVAQLEKAVGKDVSFIKKLEDSLPEIEMDKTKFKQCITELIENACHFISYDGRITIISTLSSDKEKKIAGIKEDAVSVIVKDNGSGVPKYNKRLLFNPFFGTNAKGSGMGLAIVQQYVELHGGRICEMGKYGDGAEFLIVLPIYNEDAEEQTDQSTENGHEK
ncbi:MAG: hypothetical protein GY749_09740 [Desulfobacteraceae bacterium]|nr:hypothetical protein [Desulfobacteraceae bacterium]